MSMQKLFVFLLLAGLFVFGCTQSRSSEVQQTNIQQVAQSEVLAGSVTKYLRYNEAEFSKARNEGKIIYLYFRANWCGICAAERPTILATFNEMNYENVVGFEVHFNDDETTDADREAARLLNIPYQHTTIILDSNGNEVYRSLSPISKEGIKTAIAEAIDGA